MRVMSLTMGDSGEWGQRCEPLVFFDVLTMQRLSEVPMGANLSVGNDSLRVC